MWTYYSMSRAEAAVLVNYDTVDLVALLQMPDDAYMYLAFSISYCCVYYTGPSLIQTQQDWTIGR